MEVTITRVYHDMVETKYGPKPKTSIYTEEQPEVKMSSFDKGATSLKSGDKVSITIEKNGQFTNFKVGAANTNWVTKTGGDTSELEKRIARLEEAVFQDKKEVKEEEIGVDDFENF